jgi:hypothetical protein
MITANPISTAPRGDAELVWERLANDREAFGQIVACYQSLVCSLAYSATGNLSRSGDLAQETFVTAWQQLSGLREPARLRAWLCGIARNLISNAQRRAGREPVQLAEPLALAHAAAAREYGLDLPRRRRRIPPGVFRRPACESPRPTSNRCSKPGRASPTPCWACTRRNPAAARGWWCGP